MPQQGPLCRDQGRHTFDEFGTEEAMKGHLQGFLYVRIRAITLTGYYKGSYQGTIKGTRTVSLHVSDRECIEIEILTRIE